MEDNHFEYAVEFGEKNEDKNKILKSFRSHGLRYEWCKDNNNMILVTAAHKAMLTMAERIGMRFEEIFKNKKATFTSGERVHLVYSLMQEACSSTGLHMKDDIFTLVTAIHDSTQPTGAWMPWHAEERIMNYRNYYGDEAALYFAFMQSYNTWLFIPAILGCLFYITIPAGVAGSMRSVVAIGQSKFVPLFSFFVVIWSCLFMKSFDRLCAYYSWKWGTWEIDAADELRSEFHGTYIISFITGKRVLYYPDWMRWPKYLVGVIVSLFFLSFAFGFMVLSLNLQGYIKSHESWIYIEHFSHFSDPGALFDPKSQIMWLCPCLVHSIFILILNTIYSTIAEKLTEWENHRTQHAFENSLIAKRFLFEFLDTYMPLFYIAFYQRDIMNLRNELLGLYTSDEIRRVLLECGIPFLLNVFFSRKVKHKGRLASDLIKAEYEQFDDYLEMVTQFGYVTLFASAMPTAALLSFFSNIIEMQSDVYRITWLSRRPNSMRARDIGTWRTIIGIMGWTSIITNCFLLAFCSDALEKWFPEWYIPGQLGDMDANLEDIKPENRHLVFVLLFCIEHTCILLCLAIKNWIPNRSEETDVGIKKVIYEEQQAFKQQFKEQLQTEAPQGTKI